MQLPPQPNLPLAGPGAAAVLPTAPERLHPLSPLVRVGRAGAGLLTLVLLAFVQSNKKGGSGLNVDLAIFGVIVLLGVVSWFVTTWHVAGTTLEVATGLIRRKVVRVPLARVQAVDVVEPWISRIFKLAEVRVRTGGSGGGDARLQYLTTARAYAVRSALVALAHGLPVTTPEAPERPLAAVDNARLVAASFLAGRFVGALLSLALEAVFAAFHLVVVASSFVVYVLGVVVRFGRGLANEWGLRVSEAPDGVRITTGVGSRVRETIPAYRIQAVHRAEPLFWRPFGWQRLELHLAGGVAARRSQPSSVVRRTLMPVAEAPEASLLVSRLLGEEPPLAKPPRRAVARAPLSYHFLSAGHDGSIAASTWGRVCRRTEFVPLAKVQSIHYVQGPLLRILGLATVRVHAAGRHATVSWREWDAKAAAALVEELTLACAAARARQPGRTRPVALADLPPPPPRADPFSPTVPPRPQPQG